jgi:hypothetical protein
MSPLRVDLTRSQFAFRTVAPGATDALGRKPHSRAFQPFIASNLMGTLPSPPHTAKLGEKADKPAVGELARHHGLAVRVDGMNQTLLARIEPNARDRAQFLNRLAHGRLSLRCRFDNDHLGTLMPFGAPSTQSFHGERKINPLPEAEACSGAFDWPRTTQDGVSRLRKDRP